MAQHVFCPPCHLHGCGGCLHGSGDNDIIGCMPRGACRFKLGRQEDSHEFLRCLLDAMHEACLKQFKPKPPPDMQATTFINKIFGGKLRSRVSPCFI